MTKRPSDDNQEPKPQADERNIVPLDSSYEGASLEDRLFLFWNDYRKLIVGTVIFAVVVLLGWGAILVWQERREARIQFDYREAVTIDEKKAFAEANTPHRLAGIANLEIADYHFNNQEYEEAMNYYARAASDLKDYPVAGRALVGQGFCLSLVDRMEDAVEHLESVGDDTSVFGVFRAEAYYHAGVLANELGDTDRAWDLAGRVAELDQTQSWAAQALQLRATLPQAEEEDLRAPMPMPFSQRGKTMPPQQIPGASPGEVPPEMPMPIPVPQESVPEE